MTIAGTPPLLAKECRVSKSMGVAAALSSLTSEQANTLSFPKSRVPAYTWIIDWLKWPIHAPQRGGVTARRAGVRHLEGCKADRGIIQETRDPMKSFFFVLQQMLHSLPLEV